MVVVGRGSGSWWWWWWWWVVMVVGRGMPVPGRIALMAARHALLAPRGSLVVRPRCACVTVDARGPCLPHLLQEGEAYVLSDSVRNACLHGVLSNAGSEHRASLNLRFGLHSADRAAEYSAWNEVDRHWEEAAKEGAATAESAGGAEEGAA